MSTEIPGSDIVGSKDKGLQNLPARFCEEAARLLQTPCNSHPQRKMDYSPKELERVRKQPFFPSLLLDTER